MRNTDSSGKTLLTTLLSSRALSRSWPNGFSMTTRLQRSASGRASLDFSSCSHTTGNDFGVELFQGFGQPAESVVVIEAARHETESVGQPIPDHLAKRGAGVLFDGV